MTRARVVAGRSTRDVTVGGMAPALLVLYPSIIYTIVMSVGHCAPFSETLH